MSDKTKMKIKIYDDGDPQKTSLWEDLLETERELKNEPGPKFTEKPWIWTEKTGKRDVEI
jgi:hypothetical protein